MFGCSETHAGSSPGLPPEHLTVPRPARPRSASFNRCTFHDNRDRRTLVRTQAITVACLGSCHWHGIPHCLPGISRAKLARCDTIIAWHRFPGRQARGSRCPSALRSHTRCASRHIHSLGRACAGRCEYHVVIGAADSPAASGEPKGICDGCCGREVCERGANDADPRPITTGRFGSCGCSGHSLSHASRTLKPLHASPALCTQEMRRVPGAEGGIPRRVQALFPQG